MAKTEELIQNNLKILARSSVIVFVGIALSKILMYLYRIFIVRHFGLENYGIFSLALIVLGWFCAFSTLGFTDGLLRYIPFFKARKKTEELKYLLRKSFIILTISSFSLAVIMFVFADKISIGIFHSHVLSYYLKWFSLLIPVTTLATFFLNNLRGNEEVSSYSFIINIFQNVLKLGAVLFLAYIGLKTNALILSYFLAAFGMLFLAYYLCRKKFSWAFSKLALPAEKKKQAFSGFFSYSLPLFFFSIITSVFFWIDSSVLGYFKSASDVGLYNVAVPLAMILTIIPDIFMQMFFPLITREFSRNKKKVIKELSKQVSKWIFMINLPIFLLIFLFPGAIINVLFGQSSLAASGALRILSVGIFILSITVISQNLISMSGRSKVISINFFLAALLNLILCIAIIPRFGIEGAATATLITYIFLFLAFMIQNKIFLSFVPVRRKIINILLISLIPLGILLLLRNFFQPSGILSLALIFILFILLYVISLFVARGLDRNDLMMIHSFKNKFFSKKPKISEFQVDLKNKNSI